MIAMEQIRYPEVAAPVTSDKTHAAARQSDERSNKGMKLTRSAPVTSTAALAGYRQG